MKITCSRLKTSLKEYIDEQFAMLESNIYNAINCTAAKLYIDRKFDSMVVHFLDEDHKLDVDQVREYFMPQIKKMKIVEIPAGPTKYKLNESDFNRLFNKLNEDASLEQ